MKDETTKRCLVYRRVATNEPRPDGSALDAQREILMHFAARMGATVVLDFAEVVSGRGQDARRLELEWLLDAVRPGDVVAVSRLDRLTRESGTAVREVRRILRQGARFISVTEGELDDSPATGLMLSNLACAAP